MIRKSCYEWKALTKVLLRVCSEGFAMNRLLYKIAMKSCYMTGVLSRVCSEGFAMNRLLYKIAMKSCYDRSAFKGLFGRVCNE